MEKKSEFSYILRHELIRLVSDRRRVARGQSASLTRKRLRRTFNADALTRLSVVKSATNSAYAKQT